MTRLAYLGVSFATGYSHTGTRVSQCSHSFVLELTRYSNTVSLESASTAGRQVVRPRIFLSNLARSSCTSMPPSAQVAQYRKKRSITASGYTSLDAWQGASTALSSVSSVVTWQKSRLTCSHGAPGMTGRHSSRMQSSRPSMYLSKHGFSIAASCGFSLASQLATSGFQPSSVSET